MLSTYRRFAKNARAISRELFEMYWRGFEVPGAEEDPIVVDIEALRREESAKEGLAVT